MDLFTLEVFEYLNCNIDEVKKKLLFILEEVFVVTSVGGYTLNDIEKIVSGYSQG